MKPIIILTNRLKFLIRAIKPFFGFADDIEIVDGYVGLPDTPGIGFESKAE